MSRIHFMALAAAFRLLRAGEADGPTLDATIEAVATVCAKFNANFDLHAFYRAAHHTEFTE